MHLGTVSDISSTKAILELSGSNEMTEALKNDKAVKAHPFHSRRETDEALPGNGRQLGRTREN